ncbi:MAG: hypothetical protein IJ539_05425 [Prevotella sp.]|nr:hypothetical protein [Prevotella sp.]MBQ9534082.1 hypothetical protein [Prevotella sp.]
MNKKTYIIPTLKVKVVGQQTLLQASTINIKSPDVELGDDSDEEARARTFTIWDE